MGYWLPKFSNFNSFYNWVEFGAILEGLRNFGGGGFEPPKTPLGTPLSCIILALGKPATLSSGVI